MTHGIWPVRYSGIFLATTAKQHYPSDMHSILIISFVLPCPFLPRTISNNILPPFPFLLPLLPWLLLLFLLLLTPFPSLSICFPFVSLVVDGCRGYLSWFCVVLVVCYFCFLLCILRWRGMAPFFTAGTIITRTRHE